MIPIFKLFTLSTRLFTRPILMYIKGYHKTNAQLSRSLVARPFIALGKLEYRVSIILNKHLFKVETNSDMFLEPLEVDEALKKGLELFYEFSVYALILGISIYEIHKYNLETQISKEKEKEYLEMIEQKIDKSKEQQKMLDEKLLQLNMQLDILNTMKISKPHYLYKVFQNEETKNQYKNLDNQNIKHLK